MQENTTNNIYQNQKTQTSNTIIDLNTSNIFNKPPQEDAPLKESNEEESEAKQNLLFKEKNISAWKLYTHISGKFEIFLMILGAIATIGAGCSKPIVSLLLGDIINDFTDTSEVDDFSDDEYNELMKRIEPSINDMIKKFIIFGVCMFVCNFLMMFTWSYSALRQMLWLKVNYFRIILRQEQGWFDENNAFEFSTKVQAQIEQIEMGVGDKFGQIILMISEFISGIIIGFISSWKITLVFFCCAPIIISAFVIMSLCMEEYIVKSRKTYEKAGGIAEELLYNIKTVTSFVNFDYELNRFGNLVDEVEKYDIKKSFILGIAVGLMIFGIFFGFSIALVYARKIIADNATENSDQRTFNAGDVLKVIFGVLGSIFAVGGMAPNIETIKEACIASSDYFTLYERTPKIYVSESNLMPPRDNIKGKIEFRNIKFSYPSDKNNKLILDGLNLMIEPGKKVAIVGESGCGKSTTVNLIERLYEPVDGEILIDDVNIKEYNLQYLRNLIGYVQQEPVLFNKSINENLIFGRDNLLDEIGDRKELIEDACKDAFIKNFIEKNPEKYEYIVGVKGSKLSGGQKQRIAIARAILLKPKILILDEATSALDNQSEKEVQKALDHIGQKNVTTVIIAHRLSTIKNADLIYALKNGKVIEKGTHQELLNLNGYYAGLVKSQLAAEEFESKEVNYNKIANKKSTMMNRVKKLSSHCSDIYSEISNIEFEEKDENIEIDRRILWDLISDKKFDLFLGLFSGFVYGATNPFSGVLLAKETNVLSIKNANKIRKDGLKYSLLFLVLAVVGGVSTFVKIRKLQGLGSIITCRMRKKILKKYLELHVGYYDIDANSPGALLTKLSIDSMQLSSLILTILGAIITTVGTLIISYALSFYFDWKLTLIVTAFLPFIVASTVLMGAYKENGREGNKKIRIEAGSILSECVNNTKTVYSFNFQESAILMYKNILDRETKDFLKDSIMQGLLIGFGTLCMYIAHAVDYKCSFVFMKHRTLTFDNMNYVIDILMSSVDGVSDSLRGITDYPKAKSSFQSISKTLNTPSEINAFENENINKKFPEVFKGKIEFKNVTFSYPTKPKQLILKNLSLIINPGQQVAMVGYSGSGKSTVIQLILRYYDVNEGEVLIDDINIKDYNLYNLRKKIGLVSQEPVLFKRSVYENILYGKLDAKKDEVYNSAKRAAILKFFNDKEMGTKEDPVSGGEKQRLAIARAFLKDPVILLLDEATSALDKESEIEVQKSIYELQKGRTSVSVAHRLSTIINSDVIFVLESGRLVEKGTHEELLNMNGKYATLYKYSEK